MESNGRFIFPELFAERMKELLGEEYEVFEASYSEGSQVSLRIHPEKWSGGLSAVGVPWCSTGYYLPGRPLFTADPWLHGGAYYVQEASSMFLEQLCRAVWPDSPALVLDLCAAPGGKTTHLMSMLRGGDLLVSNEVIRSRAHILRENVTKWGSPGVVVTQGDPAAMAKVGEIFDLIVVDAPCSGEGLFRKDPRAMEEWSLNNTRVCASRQKRILAEAWKCLKPGGALIYSTCTFNQEEDEENVAWLLAETSALPVEVNPDPAWKIEVSHHGKMTGYRFYPHRLRGEGFFCAVVRKDGHETPSHPLRGLPQAGTPASKKQIALLENWLSPGNGDHLLTSGESLFHFPRAGWPLLALLEKSVPLLQAGIPVATSAGDTLIPHPALAFSSILNREAFPEAPLSLSDAIRFLRKDPLPLPGREKGWILASYRDLPLGWLKNLGNRTNNYYPQEYRIRMTPDDQIKPWHETLTHS